MTIGPLEVWVLVCSVLFVALGLCCRSAWLRCGQDIKRFGRLSGETSRQLCDLQRRLDALESRKCVHAEANRPIKEGDRHG
jgi:hypothetical protein